MKITTAFDIGDQVTIDRDDTGHIVGLVLAINVRGTGLNVTYDVSWLHNGCVQSAWLEEWRLNKWEG